MKFLGGSHFLHKNLKTQINEYVSEIDHETAIFVSEYGSYKKETTNMVAIYLGNQSPFHLNSPLIMSVTVKTVFTSRKGIPAPYRQGKTRPLSASMLALSLLLILPLLGNALAYDLSGLDCTKAKSGHVKGFPNLWYDCHPETCKVGYFSMCVSLSAWRILQGAIVPVLDN